MVHSINFHQYMYFCKVTNEQRSSHFLAFAHGSLLISGKTIKEPIFEDEAFQRKTLRGRFETSTLYQLLPK